MREAITDMQSLAYSRTSTQNVSSIKKATKSPNLPKDRPSTLKPAAAIAARTASGAGGALGTTAIFAATFEAKTPRKATPVLGFQEILDSSTGEILKVRRTRDSGLAIVQAPEQKRVLRYERKAAASAILGARHRISACNCFPQRNTKSIEVWSKTDAILPGHFRGLQTCSLSWLCSVCAPKIAERRAAEIEAAMTVCQAQGGQVLMPTFTIPHGRNDPLAETLDLIKKALRWISSSRRYKDLQEDLGVLGRVIATEITHGEANGWHPHFHELWMFEKSGVNVKKLEKSLFEMWLSACRKFGLGEPSRRHGVVVQDGSRAAQYVSKMGHKDWKLSDEMAKASSKGGRKGSRSAWELLDCVLDAEASPQQKKRAERLFSEFAEATKGRRQLAWTPGLKKRFSIVEMNDEELCEQVEEDAILIADISLESWRFIRLQKMQAHVLNAAQFGVNAVQAVVDFCVLLSERDKRNLRVPV